MTETRVNSGSKDLVSVIVPVHNVEDYLSRCLESVSGQTYGNLEIILVDDGSTDRSGTICDEHARRDPRVRVIHQSNKRLWAARNTGIEASRGEFLMFPDADDYIHRDTIRLMREAINLDGGYDLAIARMRKVTDDSADTASEVIPRLLTNTRDELFAGLFGLRHRDPFYPYQWNKLYRRSVAGGVRCREYLRAQDVDFNFRVFLSVRRAVLIDNDLYFWRQRPGQLTRRPESEALRHECLTEMAYRNYLELPPDAGCYDHYLLEQLYREMVFMKDLALGGPGFKKIRDRCAEIHRAIRRDLLRERGIPATGKAVLLARYHLPRLNRAAMAVAGLIIRLRDKDRDS